MDYPYYTPPVFKKQALKQKNLRTHKKRRALLKESSPRFRGYDSLFLFKAIATGATFSVATTRIAYVNLTKRTIIAGAVIFTIGYTTTNRSIYVVHVIKPPF